MHVDRFVQQGKTLILAGTILSLGACGNPYGLNISELNFSSPQIKGVIQFTDPKLYKREALINERRDELTFLSAKLSKTAADDFSIKPEIVRELETIQAFSASLGAKVDPAAGANFKRETEITELKQQYELTRLEMQLSQLRRDAELLNDQLAKQTTPTPDAAGGAPGTPGAVNNTVTAPDPKALLSEVETLRTKLETRLSASVPAPKESTGVAGPIDVLNDISAYRSAIKSAINAVQLDELHDQGGNSLFRVQLRATSLPDKGEYLDTLGILRMGIERPKLTSADVDSLYQTWLLHVNRQLNSAPDPRSSHDEMTLRASPNMITLGELGFFDVVLIEIPKNKPGVACGGVRRSARKPNDCWYVRFAVPPGIAQGDALYQELDTLIQNPDVIIDHLKTARDTAINLRRFGAPKKDGSFDSTDTTIVPPDFDLAPSCRAFKHPQSDSLYIGDPMALSAGLTLGGAFREALFIRLAWPNVAAVIGFLADSDLNGERTQVIPAELTKILPRFREAYQVAGEFLSAVANRNPPGTACRAPLLVPSSAPAPGDFNTIVMAALPLGRTSVYDVAPTERAQQISTVARAADAIALAASAAGSLPTYGVGLSGNFAYSRTATGKADAIERAPIVVGFTEPAVTGKEPSFGWLLGPQVVTDPENQNLALRQRVKPYDLYADLSLPGWWPYFNLKAYTAWAPNWRTNDGSTAIANDSLARTVKVPMIQNSADLDGLTGLILEASTGDRIVYPTIAEIKPAVVSACADKIQFQIRGENIWRASLVHIGGLAIDQSINVLPDMRGILVEIATKDIPNIVDGDNDLTVWTKDGPATLPINFQDVRKADGSCAVPAQRPTPKPGPVIASIAPSTISICETQVVFTVLGKNLGTANSASFGSQRANSVTTNIGPNDGTVIEVQVAGIDGKKMLKGLGKTMLTVRTTEGAAAADITLQQTDCN